MCIHGFGCSALEWTRVIRGLYGQVGGSGDDTEVDPDDLDVIVPSHIVTYERVLGTSAATTAAPGAATLSGLPARDVEQLCAELVDILNFLRDNNGTTTLTGPFVLLAHSYGGLVAQAFAMLHPVKVCGLVLVDPAHEDQFKPGFYPWDFTAGFRVVPTVFALYARLAKTGFLRLLDALSGFNFPPLFLYDAAERREALRGYSTAAAWHLAIDELAGANQSFDNMAQFRKDHADTKLTADQPISLVLAGNRHLSPTFSPAKVTAAFLKMHEGLVRETQAEVLMAPKSDHWIHLEQPEVVLEAVASVYQRLHHAQN